MPAECVEYSSIAARITGAPPEVASRAAEICSEWKEPTVPKAAVAAAAVVLLVSPSHIQKAKSIADALSDALLLSTNYTDKKYLKSKILAVLRRMRAAKVQPKMGVSDHINAVCSKLSCPDGVAERAKEIAELAKAAKPMGGRIPAGVAAAAVYLALREAGVQVAARDVGRAAGVTEVTVRARAKEMSRAMSG